MRKKIIYISGPITGKTDLNRPAFEKATKELTKSGHVVINPHTICNEIVTQTFADDLHLWLACMRKCIDAIRHSDAIYLLEGWQNSRGARKELKEALNNELEVINAPQHTMQVNYLGERYTQNEFKAAINGLSKNSRARAYDKIEAAQGALHEAERALGFGNLKLMADQPQNIWGQLYGIKEVLLKN